MRIEHTQWEIKICARALHVCVNLQKLMLTVNSLEEHANSKKKRWCWAHTHTDARTVITDQSLEGAAHTWVATSRVFIGRDTHLGMYRRHIWSIMH